MQGVSDIWDPKRSLITRDIIDGVKKIKQR